MSRSLPLLFLLAACSDPLSAGVAPTAPTTPTSPGTTPATGSATTPSTTTTPTTPFVCDPSDIPAGASWTPPVVTCPFGVDAAAVTECAATGSAALYGGSGYATIQAAVAAASAGETITVCPGTHGETLVVDQGKVLLAADPTAGATVLAPPVGDGPISLDDATLRGLTLGTIDGYDFFTDPYVVGATGDVLLECVTRTGGSLGRIVVHTGPGSVTVRDSRFVDNHSLPIEVEDGAPLVVEDSEFSNNETEFTNHPEGAAIIASGAVTLRRTSFVGNVVYENSSGAVVNAFDAAPSVQHVVEDCWFEGNAAEAGVATLGAGGPLLVTNTTFVGNGAGITLMLRDGSVMRDTTFDSNDSTQENARGAMFDFGGLVTLERVLFRDNVAADQGIIEDGGTGGAMFAGTHVVMVRNNAEEAAVSVGAHDTSFTCTCCDFGAGDNDNHPADLSDRGTLTDDLGTDVSL